MTQYIINDTDLLAIANSIRGKNGESTTYTVDEMPAAINAIETGGGGGELPPEAFIVTGKCAYKFSNNGWNWYVDTYGNQVTTIDITDLNACFADSNELENIPFDINCKLYTGSTPNLSGNGMFSGCSKLKSIGKIVNFYPSEASRMFNGCLSLRYLPEFENLNMSRINTYQYASLVSFFDTCYSLRKVEPDLLKQIRTISANTYSHHYYRLFNACASIDEIIGMPVVEEVTLTANCFMNTVSGCFRLKTLLFETNEDGSPKVANWSNQLLDLTYHVGDAYTYSINDILNYNSGITRDKYVADAASYERLKNDPDWYTDKEEFSRYNHDSAVATINSLPDCSAGSGNVIKFNGESGSATDGGAISTLTADEIAVATAKGWTVTIV